MGPPIGRHMVLGVYGDIRSSEGKSQGEEPVLKKIAEFLTLKWLWDRHKDKS